MARRPRTDPKKPLLKAPLQIGPLDAAAAIGELRQLHEDAEDPNLGRMPSNEELFGALRYLAANAGALKNQAARRTSAIVRVKLWEYLREQADIHQGEAIEHARAANAEWAHLAPVLAVKSPSAAYNKAMRLRAAALTGLIADNRPVRRTPEAVLKAEQEAAARVAAEQRAQAEAARRHRLLAPVARRLLEHRAGLDDDGEVTYWLDEVAAVLPSCQTPTQFLALRTYVEAVVRELGKLERATAQPAASTLDAKLAYAAAAEIVAG
ncbi:hypothetical protein [Streptomyces sp. NPDC004230]